MIGTPLLPLLLVGLMLVALIGYVVLAGADFGGGVWDMLASGPRREAQRALIADAIAPVWEANHVWLIIVVVILFSSFPRVYSEIATMLHVPLSLMLVGIVLRGSAFVFRAYGGDQRAARLRWGRLFAISSVVTPVLLGICVGAIASGELASPAALASDAVHRGGSFASLYIFPWLRPFPLGVGLLALATFAMLAAVYLTLETDDAALREDFRRRALIAGGAHAILAALVLVIARSEAPSMWLRFWSRPSSLAVLAGGVISGAGALGALVTRRWLWARLAAAAEAALIVGGWALAQYPEMLPGRMTIAAAAAPDATLRLILGALIAGSVVLLPSLLYLLRVFKGERERGRRPDVAH
ncbi:MAG: cytochrome d ubiquinol oxidase subunit II [Gemmatimonadota bacterium]|nr:cytochrome d ubiquinol oxidase subunit II [Gemmatimonadota bacterium]